ncbi:regulatory protein RecX [soil metagenome]
MERKSIGAEKALQKIKHFCSYQERSHQEVKEKLYSFGLYKEDVEELLSQVIEKGYLNEERYAVAFAGGKFRIKKWGRVKIKYELKQKRISDYCIKKGLASIDETEYLHTLENLFTQKRATLRSEKNIFIKKQKIQSFLMQRGFEPMLISGLIQQM